MQNAHLSSITTYRQLRHRLLSLSLSQTHTHTEVIMNIIKPTQSAYFMWSQVCPYNRELLIYPSIHFYHRAHRSSLWPHKSLLSQTINQTLQPLMLYIPNYTDAAIKFINAKNSYSDPLMKSVAVLNTLNHKLNYQ